jgi:hypothetical protein
MAVDYILFVLQEGNFQSRSMIVPTKAFLEARQEEYNILKQYSVKTTVGISDKEFTVVDNLIVQPIVFDGNIGTPKKKPFTDFYHQLLGYADGLDEGCYYSTKDANWYDDAIIQLCQGFNHVENYLKCKYMTEKSGTCINITDSFLFLEKNFRKKKHVECENKQIEKIINSFEQDPEQIAENTDEYIDFESLL